MDLEPGFAPLPFPTVTTIGEGRASGTPDSLRLHVHVEYRSPSVSDALAGCASRLESAVEVAHRFTDTDKIASSGLTVDQWQESDGTPTDYIARHSLRIECPDIARAGELVTALADSVGSGLRLGQVEMFVADPADLAVEARARAFADARAKADELAALAAQAVDRPVVVVEGATGGARPLGGGAEYAAMARSSTSFEPGTATVTATVTVTWAMRAR